MLIELKTLDTAVTVS